MQKVFSWNEISNLPDNSIIYGFFYDVHRINPVRTKLNLEIKKFVIKQKNHQPYSNYTLTLFIELNKMVLFINKKVGIIIIACIQLYKKLKKG